MTNKRVKQELSKKRGNGEAWAVTALGQFCVGGEEVDERMSAERYRLVSLFVCKVLW
jgi:hypothetical protein